MARGDRLEGGSESQDAIEMSGRWRCGVTERVERVQIPVAEIYSVPDGLGLEGVWGWTIFGVPDIRRYLAFEKDMALVRCRERPKGVMTLCRGE